MCGKRHEHFKTTKPPINIFKICTIIYPALKATYLFVYEMEAKGKLFLTIIYADRRGHSQHFRNEWGREEKCPQQKFNHRRDFH